MVRITTPEQNKEKIMKRIEVSLRDLWDNVTYTNIQIIEVLEDKLKVSEKIFQETIVENFPNMRKRIVNQFQEVRRVLYKVNPSRNMLRHILIKLSKIKYKQKMLKAARENQQITYRGIPIRLSTNISAETLQAKNKWQNILKVIKGETYNQDYSTQLSSHPNLTEKSKALQTSKS